MSLIEVVAALLLVLGSFLVLRAVWFADVGSGDAARSGPGVREREESARLRRAA